MPRVHQVVGIGGVAAYLSVCSEGEVQFPWQLLGQVQVVVVRPCRIAIAQVGILVVLVAQRVVQHYGGDIPRSPLHILLQRGPTIALHVVVAEVAHIAPCRLDGGDAAIGEVIARCQLERKTFTHIHID